MKSMLVLSVIGSLAILGCGRRSTDIRTDGPSDLAAITIEKPQNTNGLIFEEMIVSYTDNNKIKGDISSKQSETTLKEFKLVKTLGLPLDWVTGHPRRAERPEAPLALAEHLSPGNIVNTVLEIFAVAGDTNFRAIDRAGTKFRAIDLIKAT